jgi:hypothetical protein
VQVAPGQVQHRLRSPTLTAEHECVVHDAG